MTLRPNNTRDQLIGVIDELDAGICFLRTAFLAVTTEKGIEQDDVEAIGRTLYEALKHMEPAAKALSGTVKDLS